jgi:hypothetical protein
MNNKQTSVKQRGYYVVCLSAFVLECGSTMYISTVTDKSLWMVFYAMIGPFLGLPFVGYIIEAKNWNQRIKLAFFSSIGYGLGAILIYVLNTYGK